MIEENDLFWQAFKEWEREVLSPYCLNECERPCCDLSRLKMSMRKKNLIALLGFEPVDLYPFKTDKEGLFTYNEGFCPQFDSAMRRCNIYDHPDRPTACKRYPFIINLNPAPGEKGYITLHKFCHFNSSEKIHSLDPLSEKYQVDVFLFGGRLR